MVNSSINSLGDSDFLAIIQKLAETLRPGICSTYRIQTLSYSAFLRTDRAYIQSKRSHIIYSDALGFVYCLRVLDQIGLLEGLFFACCLIY